MYDALNTISLSPVVLFAYKRPSHTKQLLDSLAKNEEAIDTILYIICDGPKLDATNDDLLKIGEVISIAKLENRFKETRLVVQQKNKGLALSIIDGVELVLNNFDTVIVLEDDLILSPYFLYYVNDSLKRYHDNKRAGQIGCCNCFACGSKFPQTFFLAMPDCLGWATWKDRWKYFTPDASYLLKEIKKNKLEYKFNAYGSYNMESMLLDQANGKGTSWAVLWTAVCVLNDWLTLYPNPSMTNHMESQEATNANINIEPPLTYNKPTLQTIVIEEIPSVVKALQRKYSGIGDYYGNFIQSEKRRSMIFLNLKQLCRKLFSKVKI